MFFDHPHHCLHREELFRCRIPLMLYVYNCRRCGKVWTRLRLKSMQHRMTRRRQKLSSASSVTRHYRRRLKDRHTDSLIWFLGCHLNNSQQQHFDQVIMDVALPLVGCELGLDVVCSLTAGYFTHVASMHVTDCWDISPGLLIGIPFNG